MKTLIMILATAVFLLNSCSFIERYRVGGQAVIKPDGRMGVQFEAEPRHLPTNVR